MVIVSGPIQTPEHLTLLIQYLAKH